MDHGAHRSCCCIARRRRHPNHFDKCFASVGPAHSYGWASNIWLHALLNTDFWLFSTKDKLMHLLSTTWVSLPVRRLGERDQTHKGRETFFALLLAGIHVVGTSTALVITDIQDVRYRFADISELAVHYMPFYLPPISLHLGGCALLLLFEKTVHPWRHILARRGRETAGGS